VPADLVDDDNPALARVARETTPAAALAALGIDLGTSPLYTLQAVVGATGGHFSSGAALGTVCSSCAPTITAKAASWR
jgi:K+ transporter